MYLLNSAEFAVLAAAFGAEHLTGFALDIKSVRPAKTLHALYNKGLLASAEDRDALSLDTPLKAALLCCIHANRVLCVSSGEERLPLLVYPHGETLAFVQPDEYIPDSFRIWSCGKWELPGALEDEGFLPNGPPIWEDREGGISHTQMETAYPENERRLRILWDGGMYMIEYENGTKTRREAYTRQSLADCIEELLWGVYA